MAGLAALRVASPTKPLHIDSKVVVDSIAAARCQRQCCATEDWIFTDENA